MAAHRAGKPRDAGLLILPGTAEGPSIRAAGGLRIPSGSKQVSTRPGSAVPVAAATSSSRPTDFRWPMLPRWATTWLAAPEPVRGAAVLRLADLPGSENRGTSKAFDAGQVQACTR
jgi:hypothetical protein